MTGKYERILGAAFTAAVWGLALVGMALPGGAGARAAHQGGGDGSHYDRVSLSAERSRQVTNDRVHAQFGITLEDTDAVELQYRVNEIMAWATQVATHYEDVRAQSGGYRTHPVYDKNQNVDHWRATQELRVESGDPERVAELIRVLQTKVQLQSVNFSVSPDAREVAENELISEALAAFKSRAELVRENLGAGSYRIVHMKVNTSGTVPAPMQIRAMSAMAETRVAPVLEPGTSTVTVSVEGKLELRK